jgi:hypothetical protein
MFPMKKMIIILLAITIPATRVLSQNKTSETRDLSGFTSVVLEIPATVYVTQENHFKVQVSANSSYLEKINTTVEDHQLHISCEECNNWKNKSELWKDREDVIIYISLPKINGLNVEGSGAIKAQNNFITDYFIVGVEGSGSADIKDFKAEKGELSVEGSGTISVANGVAGGLVANVNGSGNITGASLSGSMMSLSIAGSGELKVSELHSEKSEITIGGSGSITLSKGTSGKILIENNGSGDISGYDLVGGTVSATVAGSGGITIGVIDALDASIVGSGTIRYKGNPASISTNINGSGSVNKM